MLTLDAMEHAPGIWVVLTAREHLTRPQLNRHLAKLRLAARRRWPDLEWFVQVEFQRRGALHANLLVKGVSVAEREQLHELLSDRWCSRVDALPVAQWSGAIADGVGVVKYISKMLAHGLKAEQAPPIGWKGHRTSQSRGYLVRPARLMREEARRSLRLKREIWHLRGQGLSVSALSDRAEAAVLLAGTETWRVWKDSRHVADLPPVVGRVVLSRARALELVAEAEALRALAAFRAAPVERSSGAPVPRGPALVLFDAGGLGPPVTDPETSGLHLGGEGQKRAGRGPVVRARCPADSPSGEPRGG